MSERFGEYRPSLPAIPIAHVTSHETSMIDHPLVPGDCDQAREMPRLPGAHLPIEGVYVLPNNVTGAGFYPPVGNPPQ